MNFNKINHILIIIIINYTNCLDQCYNNGIPILTRTISEPYQLKYQCLCPFDYYGSDCNQHRFVRCLFTSTTIDFYRPITSTNATLSFEMQCYLQNIQYYYNTKNYQLPLSQQKVKEERQKYNYYISKDYKIIWANDSSLFNQQGQVIIPQNSTQTQQQILNSYQPYQFLYSSDFFGFPITNSDFTYNFHIRKYMNSSHDLQDGQIYVQEKSIDKNIIGKLNITIDDQWLQYGIAKIQMMILQQYGSLYRVSHKVQINSARWRVYDQLNQAIDEPIFYQNTFSVSLWMILATIIVIILVSGSRLVVVLYKKYKKNKNRKDLILQGQEQQNQ